MGDSTKNANLPVQSLCSYVGVFFYRNSPTKGCILSFKKGGNINFVLKFGKNLSRKLYSKREYHHASKKKITLFCVKKINFTHNNVEKTA